MIIHIKERMFALMSFDVVLKFSEVITLPLEPLLWQPKKVSESVIHFLGFCRLDSEV
jgi:hypothetical protein